MTVFSAVFIVLLVCWSNTSLSGADSNQSEQCKKVINMLLPYAQKGDQQAQFDLAKAYQTIACGKQFVDAAHWMLKAANQNYSQALTGMGFLHLHGHGVSKSYRDANDWFKKGAQSGDPLAMFYLGRSYLRGYGVEKNDKIGAQYITEAANGGLARAQGALGMLYKDGIGVEKNEEEALFYLKKGAENGDPSSQYNLGYSYAEGTFGYFDNIEAYKWFALAAEYHTNEKKKKESSYARDKIARRMNDAKLKQAIELFEEELHKQQKLQPSSKINL
jgi:TPR repeat protein